MKIETTRYQKYGLMRMCNLLLISLCLLGGIGKAQKKEVVAYYPEWGVNHQHYYIKAIEKTGSSKLITVLIYAFVEPAPDSSGAIVTRFMSRFMDYEQPYTADISVDGVADDTTQPLRGEFNQLRKLKKLHPDLKIILSVGGWTGSTYYSDAVATSEARGKFINDCIDKFVRGNLPVENGAGGKGVAKGIFDGFDIDWEFPIDGGDDGIHHSPNDRENLSALVTQFRAKLNSIDPNLLLTMAVPARPSDMGKYNFTKDQESLDWFNIMTYDFHGSWDIKTGHHTNLFTPDTNRMSPAECSFDKAVRFIRDSLHVLPKKIMPGVAFYGKGWKHVSPVNGGLFQQGSPADGRFESSTNNYCDLLPMIQAGAELHHDDLAMASWLYNPKDSTFWTYDDAQSVALKARYSSAYNLRGIMTWEISGDDSLGTLTKVLASGNMPGDPVKSKGKAKKDAGLFLSQPKADQIFKAGTDIILKANTGKAKFSKIEFFGDGKSLGYTTQMPGSWVWFNVPAGTHTIKLVVTDEHGNSVLPEPGSVTIRVTHP